MLPEQQQRILGYFIEEARDHLNTIEQGLLNLQGTLNDPEMINEVFRAAHSIKGGAAMLGLSSIQHTAHRLEDCFKLLKEHPVQVDQKLESLFLGASDTLKSLLEHLQGPFGLSEEKASELMLEAEPVFKWLQEHLDSLVREGRVSIGNTTDNIVDTTSPSGKSRGPLPSTADGLVHLQNQTLQTLREMLQLFKQQVTPQSRQQLQNCAQELAILGKVLNLYNWCNLCETAHLAIANPDNSYLVLAKIVITQIKQSLELAVVGRDAEIVVSQELASLVAVPELELLEITSPQSNSTPTSTTTANTPEITSNPNDVEVNPVEKLNEIAADSLVSETSVNINLDDAVGVASNDRVVNENSNIDSSIDLNTDSDTKSLSPTAQDKIANISELSLQFDFDQFYDEEDELDLESSDPPCPEVGIAELNTLADLFEGKTPDLEQTWEKEEILDTSNIGELTVENHEEEQQDTDSEFIKDILFENDNKDPRVSSEGGKENLTLVQLFGNEFLDEEDFSEEQLETTSTDLKLGEEIPDAIPNYSATSNSLELETTPQDIQEGVEQEIGEDINEEIESLLSLGFDDEELEADSELPTASPTETITEIELSKPQARDFDELLLAENHNLEPVDDIAAVHTHKSEAVIDRETVNDKDLFLDDLLFADEKTNIIQNTNRENSNVLDDINELISNLSVSDTDVVSWWEPENLKEQNSKNLLPTEGNIAEELEASLSAEQENIFSSEMGDDNFDLEDLELDFGSEEQFDLMFYGDESEDLFGDLSSEQSIISSLGDREVSPKEMRRALSQQPEELELLPEFTDSLAKYSSEISKSEQSLPCEHTDLSTEEMVSLSGGFAFINEQSKDDANSDIIDSLFGSTTEESGTVELPAVETTLIQGFDCSSETADSEIYEHLEAFFSSNEFDEFNTNSNSTAATYSEVVNPEVINPEVVNPEVVNPEVVNPEVVNPEVVNPKVVNPKIINSEVINPKVINSELNNVPEKPFSNTPVETGTTGKIETDTIHSKHTQTKDKFKNPQNQIPTELSALHQAESTQEKPSQPPAPEVVDEFSHLEALLDEKEVSTPTVETDEFAALETLLNTDQLDGDSADNVQNITTSNTPNSGEVSTSLNIEDEFSDLQKLLDEVVNTIPPSAKAQKNNTGGHQISPKRRTARFEKLMKVPVKHLDEMSNLVGELVVNRNTLEQDQERLRQSLDNLLHQVHYLSDVGSRMQELYERSLLEASLLASRHKSALDSADGDRGLNELEMDRFTPFHSLSQEMIELIVRVRESSSDIEFVIEETERVARQFRQVTTHLQEGLTRSRMVPFAEATDRLKRGVRDNAIKCGKQVELVIEGQDTLIDKMILEHLGFRDLNCRESQCTFREVNALP